MTPVSRYGIPYDGSMTLGDKLSLLQASVSRRRVPVDSLIASEPGVVPEVVAKYRGTREWERRRIDVTRSANEYIILDGHHRVAAAAAEGAESVPAAVLG